MSSDNRRGRDAARPFYLVPDHVKTSGKIVQEARSSIGAGSGTLRTVETARPFTPREADRTLFRRSSAREGRPPSAFSVSTLEFEASTSRPPSGAAGVSPGAGGPLDPLDHKPVILSEGRRLTSPPMAPRPPSSQPLQIGDSAGHRLPPPRPPSGGQRSLKQRLERQKSRSINELVLPSTAKIAATTNSTRDDREEEAEPRRVQSGPKERTRDSGDDGVDARVFSATQDRNSAQSLSVTSPTSPRDADPAADDELWADTLSPLLDALARAKSVANEDAASAEECRRLVVELHDHIDRSGMFDRRSRPKHRAPILKVCFRLLDGGDPKVVLPLVKIILRFKVGGNNLSNACRLVFKLSKQEENDALFLSFGLLVPLMETLTGTPLSQAEDGLVYACGALKFLSSNAIVVKEMARQGAVAAIGRSLSELRREAKVESKELSGQRKAVVGNALVQLTSTIRNLAELSGTKKDLIETRALRSIVFIAKLFPSDTELVLNISRILSKMTLCGDCCAHILRDGDDEDDRNDDDEIFETLLGVLKEHAQKPELVVRVLFVLGNLTGKCDEARGRLWNSGRGRDAGETPMGILLETFSKYLDLLKEEERDRMERWKMEERMEPSRIENVLIKLVRIVANLSINDDIGSRVAEDAALLGLLADVLQTKSVVKDADPPDELLLNTIATVNNLSYYIVEDKESQNRAVTTGSVMKLANGLRPLAYSSNEECILETGRVYGNLSQISRVRQFMVDNAVDKWFLSLLDSPNRELVYTSVGIMINLMVDRENRPIIKSENGVHKLIDVLRDFGQNDWQLASMVCQVFWNFSEKINSAYDCFGNPEADDLCDTLSEFLDEEVALGVGGSSDDMDDETREILGSIWEREFRPVATRLLQRVESHLTDWEPLHAPEDGIDA